MKIRLTEIRWATAVIVSSPLCIAWFICFYGFHFIIALAEELAERGDPPKKPWLKR